MNITFKPKMKLSDAKKLFKTLKEENGTVQRGASAGVASLNLKRGGHYVLVFKSNLELRKLV